MNERDPHLAGTYNVPVTARIAFPTQVHIDGASLLERLATGIDSLCTRHVILGSRFERVGDRDVMVERPEARPVPVLELLNVPPASDSSTEEAALRRRFEGIACSPLNPFEGPLWSVTLIRSATHRYVLVLVAHHLICDGTSLRAVFGELLRALATGRDAAADEVPTPQYADYAVAQRSEKLDLSYWRERLRTPVRAPVRSTRARPSRRGAQRTFALDAGLERGLEMLAADLGIKFKRVLLALQLIHLAQHEGSDWVHVEVPVSGRTHEFDRVVGFVANAIVFAKQVSNEMQLWHFIEDTAHAFARDLRQGNVPYAAVCDECLPQVEPPVERARRVRYMINFLPDVENGYVLGDAAIERLRFAGGTLRSADGVVAHFDIAMLWQRPKSSPQGSELILVNDTALYSAEDMEAFWNEFRRLLCRTLVLREAGGAPVIGDLREGQS